MISSRRRFFTDVGRGMIVAGLGAGLASDMGLAPVWAGEEPKELTFGDLEPLVRLLQETEAKKITSVLVEKLNSGTDLRTLVKAATLANARTFGGDDYIGFHTMMALGPAWEMSREMPEAQRALPVLKVLYRNTNRIQEFGGRAKESLKPVGSGVAVPGQTACNGIRDSVHQKKLTDAETMLAGAVHESPEAALNALLPTVGEAPEVHRIVLIWRAWDLLNIVGTEHAHTMLRQSVHYCSNMERPGMAAQFRNVRDLVPKLLDQHKLVGRKPGTREADTAWVRGMSRTLFRSTPEQAAEAVAIAIAEGFSTAAIAEAIRQTTNELVLRDKGRPKNQTSPNKPEGSVHGDSIGVHACDSANAWCNLARVSDQRNSVACLLLGAFQAGTDRMNRGGDFLKWEAHPTAAECENLGTSDAAKLLAIAEEAIKANDQYRAMAAVGEYGDSENPAKPMFDLLRKYAISEDGALHAEKYYRTVTEAFSATRPALRWRHVAALARVTASEHGYPAPGVEEAKKLLKVLARVSTNEGDGASCRWVKEL